jgi:hypothetical protein
LLKNTYTHFTCKENLPNVQKESANGHPVKREGGEKDPAVPDQQGLDPKAYPQLRKTGRLCHGIFIKCCDSGTLNSGNSEIFGFYSVVFL